MTILDYCITTNTPRYQWRRLPVAVVIGTSVGMGVAYLSYDPLLRLLSRGTKLYVTELDQPFSLWFRFMIAFGLGGGIVSCAAVMGSSLRNTLSKAAVSSGLFFVGTIAGLVYAYSHWNPVGLPAVPLASAPMFLAPASGCVAALTGFGLAAARRAAAHRPAV